MAMNKEDIDAAIAQTENQDAIRHSLSNYFEGLNEPVSVAISLNNNYNSSHLLNREDIQEIVNSLREKGIDAVSYMDKDAQHPSKFIVSNEGINTPFLSPEDALKASVLIEDVVCNNDRVCLSGHANLLSNDSLLYSADKKIRNYHDRSIDIVQGHPHPEKITEILNKYGESLDDFIDRKVTEAKSQAIKIDFEAERQNNMMNGRENLWRGATLLGKPYACVAPRNARRVAYASSDILTSSGYTGYSGTSSGTGGAYYKWTKSKKQYGCLFKFKSCGDDQVYYADTGLEAAVGGHKYEKDEIGLGFETAVYQHKNKLEAMYLQVGPNDFCKIPTDEKGNIADPEWKDFAALHEPSDDTIYGYEAARRDAQKQQQDANPNHCYKLDLQDNLEPKKYNDEHFKAEDIAHAVAYRGNISVNEYGHVDINQDVTIDVDPRHADLKNLTVWGTCSLNNMESLSVLDMPDIRETPTGLSTKINIIGSGKLTDADKISTEDLLKVIGGYSKEHNYESSIIDTDTRIELDSLPHDFKSYTFNRVSINAMVDKLEDFPNTVHGCSYIKVRDQSSIENMDVETFKSKIMGNIGKLNHEQGDNDLSLITTNITTLPRQMSNMTFGSVHLDPHYKTLNVENFPKTKRGTFGINFEGDLSNLSTEEFLLKIKGEEWCKNNVSKEKGEDGRISIKNFDLNDNKFKITGYPKDIANFKFYVRTGEHAEIQKEWNNAANKALLVEKINQPEVILDRKDNDLLDSASELDLSHCKKVRLYGVDLSKIKVTLPDKATIEIGENVKFAPDCKLDLSNCPEGFVDASVQCGEIKLPKKISSYVDVELPQGVKEITTSCIFDSHCKFNIPPHVKITDTPDKNGKKISLKTLKACGLSKEQISVLRKERILTPIKKFMTKLVPDKADNTLDLLTTEQMSQKKHQISQVAIQQQDKDRIAELSGRTGVKSSYSVQSEEQTRTPQVNAQIQSKAEQTQTAVQSQPQQTQAKSETVKTISVPQAQTAALSSATPLSTESMPKVANMSKEEKGKFFHNLRMGINTILTKAENGLTAIQSLVKTQTETQQKPNILQMKIAKDKGKDI